MSKLTIDLIERQIALKAAEVDVLEAQLKEAKLQSPDKQHAEGLHRMICINNDWYVQCFCAKCR